MFTMHGVVMVFFFLIPSIPATLGNFLDPDHGRREGPRVPAHQPPELVHLHPRRGLHPRTRRSAAASTRAGRSTRRTAPRPRTRHVMTAALGIFITGFSSILTGLNFIVTIHRMRAPGPDVVPAAALRLGALRHQPDHDPRHAGHRDHGAHGRGRAGAAPRDLRSGARRRPGALPAPVLVLLASRPSTS